MTEDRVDRERREEREEREYHKMIGRGGWLIVIVLGLLVLLGLISYAMTAR